MPRIPQFFASALVAGLLIARLHAQERQTGSRSFQVAFDDYVAHDPIVGAAYVEIQQGRLVDWHCVGMADTEAHQQVDRNTIFHWGSITKTLTAVAIMHLRDRGKLSLDAAAVTYVPELVRVHSDHGPVSQVTIRHLLSHSAGFQNPTWPYRDSSKPWQPFEPTEWAQLVAMMPYQQLDFTPGARFSYSNPAFIYLARVIEAVTGDPYQTYIQKNLFGPLQITHSYFNVSPYALAQARSNNYTASVGTGGRDAIVANGREFDTGITTPNGGWNAPLGDLVTWVAFLSGAAPDAPRVLARASLMEMWKPVVTVNSSSERPESMGLSFFLDPRRSGADTLTFVGHTGSQAGFRAFFELNPVNGRAMIAAFNTSRAWGPTPVDAERAQASQRGSSDLRERALELLR